MGILLNKCCEQVIYQDVLQKTGIKLDDNINIVKDRLGERLLGRVELTIQNRLELTAFSQIEKAIAFSFLCSKMMYAKASVEITMGEKHNDLIDVISKTLSEMKREQGGKFNLDKVRWKLSHQKNRQRGVQPP